MEDAAAAPRDDEGQSGPQQQAQQQQQQQSTAGSPPQPAPRRLSRGSSGDGTPHVSQRLSMMVEAAAEAGAEMAASASEVKEGHEEGLPLPPAPAPAAVPAAQAGDGGRDSGSTRVVEEEDEDEEALAPPQEADSGSSSSGSSGSGIDGDEDEDSDDEDSDEEAEVEEEETGEDEEMEDRMRLFGLALQSQSQSQDGATPRVSPTAGSGSGAGAGATAATPVQTAAVAAAAAAAPSMTLGGRLMWTSDGGVVESPALPGLQPLTGLRQRRPSAASGASSGGGVGGGGGQQQQQQSQQLSSSPPSLGASTGPRTPLGMAGAEAGQPVEEAGKETEAWACPVCLQTYDEPFKLQQCGHTFCRSCIQGLIRSHAARLGAGASQGLLGSQPPPERPQCPLCRHGFTERDAQPDGPLLEEMRAARVRCPNRGCGAIYSPLGTKSHQDACPYAAAPCPHQPYGCPFQAPRKDVRAHVALCPYEQIKGLFPKLRQNNDQVTAAMRGWENAFLSQQQMLASHTAALRTLDRRSHHKPLHHVELLFTYFWEPYLWLSQRDRWTRSLSLKVTSTLCHLLPVVLALLAVASRNKAAPAAADTGGRWLFPASAEPYPYPVVGVGCSVEDEAKEGAESAGANGCAFGLSPSVSWVVLLLLLAVVTVEAIQEEGWILACDLPLVPSRLLAGVRGLLQRCRRRRGNSSTTTTTTQDPQQQQQASQDAVTSAGVTSTTATQQHDPTLPLRPTEWLLAACAAYTSYALGAAPGAWARYAALYLALFPAAALDTVGGSKFAQPIRQGLGWGICLWQLPWRSLLAGGLALGLCAHHAALFLLGGWLAAHPNLAPRRRELFLRHARTRGRYALAAALSVLGVATVRALRASWWDALQGVVELGLMQEGTKGTVKILVDVMQTAHRTLRPAQPLRLKDPRCRMLLYSRGLFLAACFGTAALYLY